MNRVLVRAFLLSFAFVSFAFQVDAQVSFLLPPGYAGSGNVFVADFNSDGKLDLLTADGTMNLGNGDGTFAAPLSYFDGANGGPLLIADFNGDGNLDIAVFGYANATGTGILYGKGDGTFQPIVFPSSLSAFYPSFTADVNNDGKADLIGHTQIALGNGDGTFTLLPPLQNAVYGIADFNGDGKSDLFVTLSNGLPHPTSTGVQLGNGDGTFGPFIQIPTNGGLIPAAFFADMNGDGRTDMNFFGGGCRRR